MFCIIHSSSSFAPVGFFSAPVRVPTNRNGRLIPGPSPLGEGCLCGVSKQDSLEGPLKISYQKNIGEIENSEPVDKNNQQSGKGASFSERRRNEDEAVSLAPVREDTNRLYGRMSNKALLIMTYLLLFISSLHAQNINKPNKEGPLGTEVNTFSGNLYIPRSDFSIRARGMNMNMLFSYNSFNFDTNTGYGNGWSFYYGAAYKADSTGAITVTWGDGREEKFTVSSGSFIPPSGIFDAFEQYQSGKYRLTTKYGMAYYFDNSGHRRLTKVADPNGNSLNLSYTDSLVTSIASSAGQTLTLTYMLGKLASIIDATVSPSRTFTYSYDNVGNLLKVTDPLGAMTQYRYLTNGPMSGITDKNMNQVDIIYFGDFSVSELVGCNSRKSFSYDTTTHKTVVTDYVPTATNQVTTYQYQVYGNQVWLTAITGNCCGYNLAYEYDSRGNITKKTDANGGVSTYTYDSRGNMLTTTDPLGNTSTYAYSSDFNKPVGYTDPKGNTYSITYDSRGNLLQTTAPGSISTSATYNSNGDVISLKDENGISFSYTWDANGNLSQVSGPANYSLGLSYNARGELLNFTNASGASFSLEYDKLSRLTKATDPLNESVTMKYDAAGNLINLIDPVARKDSFSYDASNRIAAHTNPLGKTSRYGYDAMDNFTSYTNKMGQLTRFNYDNRNRVSATVNPLGNTTNYGYDNNGNPTSISTALGNTITATYDSRNRLTTARDGIGQLLSATYDKNGNISSITSSSGGTTAFSYDALNHVTGITDALGNTSSLGYDKKGNLISIRDRNGNTASFGFDSLNNRNLLKDNNGNQTKASYDAAGNLLALTDANNQTTNYTYNGLGYIVTKTFPNGSYESYTYDSIGHLKTRRLTDGQTISYQYNAGGRMIAKILPGNEVYTYTYDDVGRLTGATNSSGTNVNTYDAGGKITSESFNGITTGYSYNTATRTMTITYPNGTVITQNYDVRNRLTAINKGGTSVASYQYNAANQLINTSFGNSVITQRQYDFVGRINSLTTAGGTVQNLSFTYNNELNRTGVTHPDGPEQFTYDAAQQLTGYSYGSNTQTFTYDSVGNRKTDNLNGLLTTYTRNNMNQLTGYSNANGTVGFTYDNLGNLTYDGTFYKRYNAEGKLLVDSNATVKLVYGYDALGRRSSKTRNGAGVNYLYSGFSPIEQRDAATNALLNETVFNGSFTPVMYASQNRSYYYHQNQLNSVEAITTENGNAVEKYRYDAYGNTIITDSTGATLAASARGNNFGFTGQQYDADTKNYGFFFRNYRPAVGTFNQRDPIGYGDGMNMYHYVHNNPSNLIDPYGLAPCPPNRRPPDNTPAPDPFGPLGLPGEVISDFLTGVSVTTFTQAFNVTRSVTMGVGAEVVGVVAIPFNALDVVTSANDFGNNYNSNTTEQNVQAGSDIALKTAGLTTGTAGALEYLATGEVAAAAGPAGLVIAGYGIANSVSKALPAFPGRPANERSIPERLYPVSERIGEGLSEEFYDKPQFNAEYGRILREQGYERAEQYAQIRKRIDEREEYKRTHPQPPNPVPTPANQPCPDNPNGTQKPPPRPNPPGTPISTEVINSKDPNEIIGPTGVGTPRWVSVKDNLPYTINYENSKSASAPAKTVRIIYPIDPKQDKNTFALGSYGFNNQTYSVPANTAAYYQRLDVRDSLGLYVDVTAGLDVVNNQAFWFFQSIDPATLLPTTAPLAGFLSLQDTASINKGHGFVNFTIKPLASDVTGDTIHAAASIVFDSNDTIPTNYAKNTVDAVAPTSHMNPAPSVSYTNTFPLSWAGADDAGASGLKSYALYYSVNNGVYMLLRNGITRQDTTFTGSNGNTYRFFVLATDSTGNVEALKSGAEVTVLVNATILPITWQAFTAVLQGKNGLLNWATGTEAKSKYFAVERSVNGRSFTQIGTVAAAGYSTSRRDYRFVDSNVVSLNIPLVYYRIRQVDNDGAYTYSNVVAVPLPTANLKPGVEVYPNPFKQTLNLLLVNLPSTTGDNVSLYTIDGKQVYSKALGSRGTSANITLDDLPQLPQGIYLLKITSGKEVFNFKLLRE